MDALISSYGSSDSEDSSSPKRQNSVYKETNFLLPPPLNLLNTSDSPASSQSGYGSRIRNFPHVDGNYALHVFIPIIIPANVRKKVVPFIRKVASLWPDIHVIDIDIPVSNLCKNGQNLEESFLGREFHISLGRTVPIRVHQIDSVVSMLRQKLQSQRRYWIEFNKWEVFVNDDRTRTFLSMEIEGRGLSEISQQIHFVDQVYRLHNLPEFYKDPRPHISLGWALGDISSSLRHAINEANRYLSYHGSLPRQIFACQFSGIECKIGKKQYTICKFYGQ